MDAQVSRHFFPKAASPIPPGSPSVARIPIEIWFAIWDLVPPKRRILLMWILSCKSSFFAGKFIQLPALWAHWYFKAAAPAHQDPHTIFAVNIWRYFRSTGDLELPLSVHFCSGVFSIAHIHWCLPPRSRTAIHELHIGLSESIFHRRSHVHDLFLAMTNLKKLHLTIFNSVFRFNAGNTWVSVSPLRPDDLPPLPQLSSLHLDGIAPESDSLSTLSISTLASLKLSDLVENAMWPSASLNEILTSGAALTSLAVRSDRGQRPPDNFWRVDEVNLTNLALRVRHLDLSGSADDLDPFVATLLSRDTPSLVSVHATFHLWPSEHSTIVLGALGILERIFDERPAVVSFCGSPLSVVVETRPRPVNSITFEFAWVPMPDSERQWDDSGQAKILGAYRDRVVSTFSRGQFPLMRTTPSAVVELAHGTATPCYAETLSVRGAPEEFGCVINALQRGESRFPSLKYMYWDGVPEFSYTTDFPPLVYSEAIVNVPVERYRSASRLVELWVRIPASRESSNRVKWIRVEWDMGHPDLARISPS